MRHILDQADTFSVAEIEAVFAELRVDFKLRLDEVKADTNFDLSDIEVLLERIEQLTVTELAHDAIETIYQRVKKDLLKLKIKSMAD